MYSREKERISLVILDLIMPEMGGGDVFHEIRKINPDAVVLIASGYSVNGEAAALMNEGCNDFIQKPFDLIELGVH